MGPPLGGGQNATGEPDSTIFAYKLKISLLSGDIETNPGPNINRLTDNIDKGPGQKQGKTCDRPNVHITDSIQILQLNAQSIKGTDLDKTKLIDFRTLVDIMDPDIMTVTETWLKDMVDDREVTDLNKYSQCT